MMEKPIFVLKPSIINAIIPMFMKNIVKSLFICLPIFVISLVLSSMGILVLGVDTLVILLIVAVAALSFFPLIFLVAVLHFTTYYFYSNYAVSEFKFIIRKAYSVSYRNVINVSLHMSLWDRLCRAGDIILHTAGESDDPDLTLKYIKEPKKIEQMIYKMVK